MIFPEALGSFLRQLDDNSSGLDFEELQVSSKNSITQLLGTAGVHQDQWESEVALIALWRSFLNAIPIQALENPRTRCRPIILERLRFLLGEEPEESDVDQILQIVKRLQRYNRLGRVGSRFATLDLESASHSELFRKQSERCAVCGYRFTDEDLFGFLLDYEESDEGERVEGSIRKVPHLDHILPVYLGGDREANWQILCRDCNLGKSDLIFGFESRSWFGSARISDLTTITKQQSYIVMKRDRHCVDCCRRPDQVELTIQRRDENGPFLYQNLKTMCVECSG